MRPFLLALLTLTAAPALANDGFGGLSATGLTFSQTDAVAMETEDLFISPTRIEVAYTFRNLTDQDVTGEVIFPLPPISLESLTNSDWNLPEDAGRDDLLGFTATVEGKPVAVSIDRIAVIEPEWDPSRPLSAQYDTPGRDVTAALAAAGVPLTVDITALQTRLLALPRAQQQALQAAGLADFVEGEVWPHWAVVIRYHWTQTFPAGARLKVAHGYDNRPPGGIFGWSHPPAEGWNAEMAAQYCVDDATSKGIVKRLARPETGESVGSAQYLDYVLRTANSWAGPIGQFRLTLDKGAERNIVSLCADGIKKTGPTTFVWERENFTPKRDLSVLIVSPFE